MTEPSHNSGGTAASRSAPRYAQIAEEIAAHIERGSIAVGERLPSVRQLAKQRRASISTALAALGVLETRGLIEARPQSGFYVAPRRMRAKEPRSSKPPRAARDVAVNRLLSMLGHGSEDGEFVPLGSAVPEASWFPSQKLQRRVAAAGRVASNSLAHYGPLAGLPALRHHIARHYAANGCDLHDDELLVTNGCMEALNLALRAVASAGDTIAVESPAYFGVLQIIESFGMKALEIPTHPQDGLSVQALAQALEARDGRRIRACVVVANFSNPLGASLPLEEKKKLVKLCRAHDVALIEDDIYGELNFSGPRPLPLKSFDTHGQVILCSSFSKTLAPGARVGWIAAGRWNEAIRLRKFSASLATPVIMQQAIADFLSQHAYERHLRKLRQSCAVQVARFSQAIENAFPAGTRISRPAGGFVLWVEMPPGADAIVMHAQAREAGISVLPGPIFTSTRNYRNCLRINCARNWTAQTQAAVARLGRIAAGLV